MIVEDPEGAVTALRRVSYYRLSGYWHPVRRFDSSTNQALDTFQDGASFALTLRLYKFDEILRHTVLGELAPIELAMRAELGHELGRVDPMIHLDSSSLGTSAQDNSPTAPSSRHKEWLDKYNKSLRTSKEDFVIHHRRKYGGKLPIWAAVEVMDWGTLSHLYTMSPKGVRTKVAEGVGLSAPQLNSWLKSLNILRNLAAHQARMFNRSYDMKPKLSQDARLKPIRSLTNRVFGQLTLIQYLHRQLGLSPADQLPSLLSKYPHNPIVPLSRTGAPNDWASLELWRK
ncbi:Abi family protein [Actinomyces lilanjuaniae]|uniref:Abi family protein n=2 Tax=Actinomyces lilanjuaniae TaxID=2321394 RepID=A0ABN5PSJ7_9ACTO|nr:Abi family protein [Actinomyces lilanjuaniae]